MVSSKIANRPAKRNLVRWNDDLDKQVLLIVQYACNEAGVRIPWDDVARMMCEVTDQPVTGGAIIQHLSKLRSRMESYELGVPPPLKRGLPANTPSKIYAAGNKRKVKPSKAKTAKFSTAKPKKPSARKLKSEDSEDSEGSPVFYEDDEQEDSDGEYGSTQKKRRISGGKGKGKKQLAVALVRDDDDEQEEDLKTETPNTQEDDVKNGTVMAEADTHERIERQSPLARTRGVKHNYAKMDAGPDENGDEDDEVPAEEEIEEEEDVEEQNKFVGEVSPRTNVKSLVTDSSGFVDMTSNSTQGYPELGFGLDLGSAYHFDIPLGQQQVYQTQQYQMPFQAGMGFPQSTGSSFSISRTGSIASLTSAMAPPYTPYTSSGLYAPMINNRVATNDASNDITYGDQYISPIDYSSEFLSSFHNPFSAAKNDAENEDIL